jgi:5-hydroxyisourate hydrolase
MSSCSTHVLDSTLGAPAAGVAVALRDAEGVRLAEERTDDDGRIRFGVDLAAGEHELTFATGDYFADAGRPAFHPRVVVPFLIDAERPHHHVALLLSPYSYTTYRGS